MKILFCFFLLFSFNVLAQKVQQEKELDLVNFSSLKNVLKQDGLAQEAKAKQEASKKIKEIRGQEQKSLYTYPSSDIFWSFMTEYWMVKNASLLKWDMDRPDYGLEIAFANLLKSMGNYEKTFKILMIDNPAIPHAGLPANHNEYYFILSLPFIRSLDLSKLEISLLLLEDMMRLESGYFKTYVRPANLEEWCGANFQNKKIDLSLLENTSKKYSEFFLTKGFSFQEQFDITKRMDAALKSSPELWNAYIKLLNKIDRLIKSNQLFDQYNKLYPSAEMQIKWLSPSEKVL